METKNTYTETKERPISQEKVPTLGHWLVYFCANDQILHSLIGSSNTVLIKVLLIIMELLWLDSKDANETIAAQFLLDRASLSSPVETRFQELLYKVQLRWQEWSAGSLAAQSEFSLKFIRVIL